MDRKAIMGIAAVAGIGLLLYMRKQGDATTLAESSSLLSSAGEAANWATQPIVINAITKPQQVADASASSPAPSPAPSPAAAKPLAPTFGGAPAAAAPNPTWQGNQWVQASGAPVDENYTFGHLTPEQRKGKTDSQLALSILGY